MRIRLSGAVNLKGGGGGGGVGVGLQVHGIGGCKLVYKEVVKVESSYMNSYFW